MNYPTNVIKKKEKVLYSNRGMLLECDINETNKYYLINNIAIIHKKPTPVVVRKVTYPSKKQNKIIDGYFSTPSTTDYNGLYRGRYIDFEAKETKNKGYFPLNNIHTHQIKHIESIINHGGISFLIIKFTLLNKVFLLEGRYLVDFIKINNRKSIPIDYFMENAYIVEEKYKPRLDYIKIIDKIYFKGEI